MPEKPLTFLQACWRGDLAEISRQLDNGARINQIGRDEMAGVHIAIKERNLPLLRLLVERGAATFTAYEKSFGKAQNAVEYAVGEGFIEGFKYLVDERGLSMEPAPNKNPAMLLFNAVENPGFDAIIMVRHLVDDRNLDPRQARLSNGYNLLHASELAGGSTGVTEFLLDKKVDPNIEFVDDDDEPDEVETGLEQYEEENPPDFELDQTVLEVLESAAEREQEEEDNEPAPDIRFSASDDDDDDDDDDFDFIDAAEGYPLNMAASSGARDRVVLYLRHGADSTLENVYGYTAIDAVSDQDPYYEYMQEAFAQIESILEKAVEKHTVPRDMRNKLLRACQLGELNEVRKLLHAHKDDHAYIHATDEWGEAAIHIAMKQRNLPLLRLLVESGADPYQSGSLSGNSKALPVAIAAENGFLEGIRYLVDEKGFKLWPAKDTPAEDLLFSAGTVRVMQYFVEEKGLDPAKAVKPDGMDLLLHAEMVERPLPLIEYILDHGIDLNHEREYNPVHEDGTPEEPDTDMFGNELPSVQMRKEYGGLPLVRAAFNAQAQLVDLYLRHDADPLQWNSHSNSALNAISEPKNPLKEFNAVAYRQISRMLQKAVEGTYGVRQPDPPVDQAANTPPPAPPGP